MKLYEVINPSDTITFYAPDNDIAVTLAIILGNGKVGLEACDDSPCPNTMYLYRPIEEETQLLLELTLLHRKEECKEAARTFACVNRRQRKIYDEFTKDSTDAEQIAKWDQENRTSLFDMAGSARKWGARE